MLLSNYDTDINSHKQKNMDKEDSFKIDGWTKYSNLMNFEHVKVQNNIPRKRKNSIETYGFRTKRAHPS